MEIVLRVHRATVTDAMSRKAERMVAKAVERLPRAVDATVRFEQHGNLRRVEGVLRAPRHEPLVATGEHRYFGPALALALARLGAQMRREQRAPKARARRATRRVGDG